METSHCAIHDADEEVPEGPDFDPRVCFECGHVFKVWQEIVDLHIELYFGDNDVRTEADTRKAMENCSRAARDFCPLCLHDWV